MKIVRLTESDIRRIVLKVIEEQKNTQWPQVVNYIKKNGIDRWKFHQGLEKIESQGLVLMVPGDKTKDMWLKPDGTFQVWNRGGDRNGSLREKGKWSWDGKNFSINYEK